MSASPLWDNTVTVRASDFPENLIWLNSPPLSLKHLQGRVVLLDFWTYSCINCQRTIPYLNAWWQKYHNLGLVIIGIHTPEFEFEKEISNVKEAVKRLEISFPVVLDNDYIIWNLYTNHYWPAKYLLDCQGRIVYTHFGEGNYLETELQIQQTLINCGYKVPDDLVGELVAEKASAEQTPELYCGSARGSVVKIEPSVPASHLQSDQIYIIGDWGQQPEYLEHIRETEELVDLVILKYRAKKVYLVTSPDANEKQPVKVYLTLDGISLQFNGAGSDVQFDQNGRSFIEVSFSNLYNLVNKEQFGEHILRLSTVHKGLKLYAFTFGS